MNVPKFLVCFVLALGSRLSVASRSLPSARRNFLSISPLASKISPSLQPAVKSMSISQRLLAGGVSRAIAQMTLYPIDALRTLAQTRDGRTLAEYVYVFIVGHDVCIERSVRKPHATASLVMGVGSFSKAPRLFSGWSYMALAKNPR
jgi:hypothetical protein